MKKVTQFLAALFILNILTIGSIAMAQETTSAEPEFTPANIDLSATLQDKTAKLSWEISDGTAPKGYKIIWSLLSEPEFPIRDNDYFNSAPNEQTSEMVIDYFLNPGLYYARVCIFDGTDQCLNYSNQVTFNVEEIPSTVDEENSSFEVTSIEEAGNGSGTDETMDSGTDPSLDEIPEITLPEDIYNNMYKKAITYMYRNQIVSGYPDGTFKPNNNINRAEFTKIIAETTIPADYMENCLENLNNPNVFNDVNTADWYAPAVCAAKEKGIIGGYPDGTFKPAQEISFVEAAKIITLAMGEDITETDTWYQSYVEKLAEKHAIPTTIEGAEHKITRAEMSEIVYRLREKLADEPFLTYQEAIESI